MENKFKIGQQVYFIWNNNLELQPIKGIFCVGTVIYYFFEEMNFSWILPTKKLEEKRCFLQKEDLFEALSKL